MKRKSTLDLLATIVLAFEIVVIFLSGLTIFGLKAVNPAYAAMIGAGALIVLVVIAIYLIRSSKKGLVLGHALHVIYFLPTFFLPAVAIVAAIFGGLWVFALYKGKQIDDLHNSMDINDKIN